MNRQDFPDLAQLVTAFPHGVATRAELIKAGVSSSVITARSRPGGPWRRMSPGVLLLSHVPPGQVHRMYAALCHAGPGAAITGRYALAAHGLLAVCPEEPVHILVPSGRRVRSAESVIVERHRRSVPRERIGGVAVVFAPRAAVDGARWLARDVGSDVPWARPAYQRAEILLASVIGHGPCDARTLLAELGARGSWLPRRVLRRFINEPDTVERALDRAARSAERWQEDDASRRYGDTRRAA